MMTKWGVFNSIIVFIISSCKNNPWCLARFHFSPLASGDVAMLEPLTMKSNTVERERERRRRRRRCIRKDQGPLIFFNVKNSIYFQSLIAIGR
jgi:hypothetical protein